MATFLWCNVCGMHVAVFASGRTAELKMCIRLYVHLVSVLCRVFTCHAIASHCLLYKAACVSDTQWLISVYWQGCNNPET